MSAEIPNALDVHGDGYRPAQGEGLTICLDGRQMVAVTAYNIAEGWVEFLPKDNLGCFLHADGELVRRRLTGKVTVTREAP